MEFLDLLIWGVVLFVTFILVISIKPLIPLLRLKYQLGSKATFAYFPILGQFRYWATNYERNNDAFYNERTITQANQNAVCHLTNMLIWPSVLFADPSYAKEVYMNHQNYEKLNLVPDDRLIKRSISFTYGKKWKDQRAIWARHFTFEKIQQNIPRINDIVKEQTREMDTCNLIDQLSVITGNIIIGTFFSDDMKTTNLNGCSICVEGINLFKDIGYLQKNNFVFAFGQLIFGQRIWSMMKNNKNVQDIYNRVTKFRELIDQVVQNRLVTRGSLYQQQNISTAGFDFLDMFLYEYTQDATKSLTIEDISQEFVGMFMAGTDTTAHVVAHTLLYLGQHQEAQQEIREEVQAVIQKDGTVEYQDLARLEKLSSFIKEVLRIHSPVPGIAPRKATVAHYVKDIKIEKGWYVNVALFSLQSNEKHFDRAKEFLWKRWLGADPIKTKVDQGFVNPVFAAGGRNCIGQHMSLMETKIILSQLLNEYQFTVDKDLTIKWQLKLLYSFTPDNAIKCTRIKK